MPAQHLGHYLAEEQQEEREENGNDEELQPISLWPEMHDVGKDIVEKHDDGDIHKVVGDENGGQRSLRVFSQHVDVLVFGVFFKV